MKRIYVYIVCLFVSFSGCIEEYTPTGINEIKNLLVVDGIITNDTSVISLRRSIGLQDDYKAGDLIEDAVLYVETNDGMKMPGTYQGNGSYAIPTGVLDSGKQYRLCISLNNEEYASAFLSPLFTPEIDSISVSKKGMGEPVFINISTADKNDISRYYLWSYKEIWEVKAEYFADGEMVNGQFVFHDLQSSNNRYYCWARDSSKTLLLESTEKLSTNVVVNKKLVEIPSSHPKLSILYYIKVNQNQIRREAYEYYSNVNKNREQTGSIFSPMPSEIKGNIKCVSNSDSPVLGYVEVSTSASEVFYLPTSKALYEPEATDCGNAITESAALGFPIYKYEPRLYAPQRCTDCRIGTYGGTKNKPDFWPTDHL